MLTGKVVLFNKAQAFGLVRPDNGDVDVFVHIHTAREGESESLPWATGSNS
jgi:cold shock CspA family protein